MLALSHINFIPKEHYLLRLLTTPEAAVLALLPGNNHVSSPFELFGKCSIRDIVIHFHCIQNLRGYFSRRGEGRIAGHEKRGP